jgi:hypothetical protein
MLAEHVANERFKFMIHKQVNDEFVDLLSPWMKWPELTKTRLANILLNAVLVGVVALYVVGDKVYITYDQAKSGGPETTTLNCQLNGTSWRYIFICLAREHNIEFEVPYSVAYDLYVVDYFVGDDCRLHVADHIKDWFNQSTAAKAWKKYLNVSLTSSSKEDITDDFENWNTAAIIKRTIEWRAGYCYAPLPKSVIEEMCLWCAEPKRDATIMAQTVVSALYEAVHHGKEYYTKLYAALERACRGKIRFAPLTFEAVDKRFKQS